MAGDVLIGMLGRFRRRSPLTLRSALGLIAGEASDAFAADAHPVNMSQPELQHRLMMVPGADDYDVWLQVGMALGLG